MVIARYERRFLLISESPLARLGRPKESAAQDSPGRCSDSGSGSPKVQRAESSMSTQTASDQPTAPSEERQEESQEQENEKEDASTKTTTGVGSGVQNEEARRRELALRQHAFFQLRLHLRRGANLVAMDRCGEFDFNNGRSYSFSTSICACKLSLYRDIVLGIKVSNNLWIILYDYKDFYSLWYAFASKLLSS